MINLKLLFWSYKNLKLYNAVKEKRGLKNRLTSERRASREKREIQYMHIYLMNFVSLLFN